MRIATLSPLARANCRRVDGGLRFRCGTYHGAEHAPLRVATLVLSRTQYCRAGAEGTRFNDCSWHGVEQAPCELTLLSLPARRIWSLASAATV